MSTFTSPDCWADAAGAAASPTASMAVVTNAQKRTLVLRMIASMASSLIGDPYPGHRVIGQAGSAGHTSYCAAVAHRGRGATRVPEISSDRLMARWPVGQSGTS